MLIGICDNEEKCLHDEEHFIHKVLDEMKIEHKIICYADPIDMIESGEKYDIVFLDVEMEGMSGIEAAERIHGLRSSTLIFFVTNYEGYMDEALNKHAFRFWIKPINRQRLIYGIESALKELNSANSVLSVTVDKRLMRIPMKDIIYINAQNKITAVVTVDGVYDVKEAYKNVLSRLNGGYFFPSHASYCVNLNFVVKYTKNEVICSDGSKKYTVFMSRRKYNEFAAKFVQWAGENI
ncbi:MAG: LytTR family DNA-binding domain-containing protein [bacterium]|nr:LytTR family DNA-binding domain-containing protein [bacterium]